MTSRIATFLPLAALLLSPVTAFAQDAAPPPHLPPAPPAPAGAFTCGAGDVDGIAAPDARTVVDLVCREVARAAPARGAFRVHVRPLGREVVLILSVEDGPVRPRDERMLRMAGVEDAPVAAPRLVEALLGGRKTEDTQRLDNLVREDTRPLVNKAGETAPVLGVFGLSVPGYALAGPGVSGGIHHVMPRYSVGGDLRIGGAGGGDWSASYVAASVGGRYFLSDSASSVFVGGGAGLLHLGLGHNGSSPAFDGSRTIFAPYAELGVQLFRLNRARLTANVRVDVPFQSLRDEHREYDPASKTMTAREESRWVVPITYGVAYSF